MTPGMALCAATRRRPRSVFALATAALALAAACGTAGTVAPPASPAPSVVRPPDPGPDTVPAPPKGRPLLTIAGRIAATNGTGPHGGGVLRLDQAGLDRPGVAEMQVDDPWTKRRSTMQGCWLRDVVASAKPDAAATTLHVHALDDYQVDLALSDVRTLDIFLATRTGQGAPLPVADGGPTRVVFGADLAPRFSPDLWIWNIDTIDVR